MAVGFEEAFYFMFSTPMLLDSKYKLIYIRSRVCWCPSDRRYDLNFVSFPLPFGTPSDEDWRQCLDEADRRHQQQQTA